MYRKDGRDFIKAVDDKSAEKVYMWLCNRVNELEELLTGGK